MKNTAKNCTESTIGYIKKVKSNGLDFPTMITVEYCVNGIHYEIKEPLRYKKEVIKFCNIPIGQREIPTIGNTSVGEKVDIKYNPFKPGDAFIVKNLAQWKKKR